MLISDIDFCVTPTTGGRKPKHFIETRNCVMKNPIWFIFWLLVLFFIAFFVAFFASFFYIWLYMFEACCGFWSVSFIRCTWKNCIRFLTLLKATWWSRSILIVSKYLCWWSNFMLILIFRTLTIFFWNAYNFHIIVPKPCLNASLHSKEVHLYVNAYTYLNQYLYIYVWTIFK